MELRRISAILARRLGLMLAITALTALISLYYARSAPGTWQATTELLIDPLAPASSVESPYYNFALYQEQAAQYILDDFAEVIRGTSFSQQVAARLKQSPQAEVRAAAMGFTTPEDFQRLSKHFTVNRVNRVLKIEARADSKDVALAMAAAADQVVGEQGPAFFMKIGGGAQSQSPSSPRVVDVAVSDQPHIVRQPSKTGDALLWLLRTAVGAAAALVVALVLHYFDDRVYDAEDVRALVGVPVLGTVRAATPERGRAPHPRAAPATPSPAAR